MNCKGCRNENSLVCACLGYRPNKCVVYVGLSITDPNNSEFTEPSGGSYARVPISTSDWKFPSLGCFVNKNEIAFPEATDLWGTVTHFGLFDEATGGNLWIYGSLGTPRTITSGDIATFAVGAIDVSVD